MRSFILAAVLACGLVVPASAANDMPDADTAPTAAQTTITEIAFFVLRPEMAAGDPFAPADRADGMTFAHLRAAGVDLDEDHPQIWAAAIAPAAAFERD